jgi:hypothetical protein
MNQVQRAATVGASRERRCQRVRGFLGDVVWWLRVAVWDGVWVAVVTVSLVLSISSDAVGFGGYPPGGYPTVNYLFSCVYDFAPLQNRHSKRVAGKFVQSKGLRVNVENPGGFRGFFSLLYSL